MFVASLSTVSQQCASRYATRPAKYCDAARKASTTATRSVHVPVVHAAAATLGVNDATPYTARAVLRRRRARPARCDNAARARGAGAAGSVLVAQQAGQPASESRHDATAHPPARRARVAVLVSGGGRSLDNLARHIDERRVTNAEIVVVVASKRACAGLSIARAADVPKRVVCPADFADHETERDDGDSRSSGSGDGSDGGDDSAPHGVSAPDDDDATLRRGDAFSDAIASVLDEFSVDLVVLGGWMHFVRIPPRYAGRVINIHPALMPAFCGKGFYGMRVHRAVIEFGAKLSGCTVHFADNEYDHGPVILQRAVPVLDDDTPDTLARRVFDEECRALPAAVHLFANGRLQMDGRRVRILSVAPSATSGNVSDGGSGAVGDGGVDERDGAARHNAARSVRPTPRE